MVVFFSKVYINFQVFHEKKRENRIKSGLLKKLQYLYLFFFLTTPKPNPQSLTEISSFTAM